MIIDCHTHVNNYHNEDVESLSQCILNLQQEMRRNRIDVAMVLTSYKINPGRPSARATIEATRHLQNVFVVAGLSYYTISPETFDELRQFLKEGSLRGLKLYPGYEPYYPNDPKLTPVYELAEEFDVPVMLHSGDTYSPSGKIKYSHPLQVDDIAVDHPRVNFVICHLGNPWIRDCMEVVYKNKNVYTDISGLTLGDFTDRFEAFMSKQIQDMLVYGVESEKVLFGTDWPLASMASYIEFMEELSIPEKDKRKILCDNAAKLFKIEVTDKPLGLGSLLNRIR